MNSPKSLFLRSYAFLPLMRFRMHRELYPSDCKITTELHRELQAMILHAYTGASLATC